MVGAFTEPPVDNPDYTRTYEIGQVVFITWNISWPRVHLRLDPLSSTDNFLYGVTYAVLIGLFLPISVHTASRLFTLISSFWTLKTTQPARAPSNGPSVRMTTSPQI